MRTIKLDLTKYDPYHGTFLNVFNCLPGEIEIVTRQRGATDDWTDMMVDKKNKRIYLVETEDGPIDEQSPNMRAVVSHMLSNRDSTLTGKAMLHGYHLLDYDVYLIAAGRHKTEGPWYEFLGDDYTAELAADNVPVDDGFIFSYVVLPFFDRGEYLKKYDENNHPGDAPLDRLSMMEKYIYQRTKIDLDVHGKELLVYQDECPFEVLLACVNWFHDGRPTIYADDAAFFADWDRLDERLRPYDYERALTRMRGTRK